MRSRLADRAITGSRTSQPAIGTVDVAVAQGAAVQQAEPVEQEVRVRAGAVEMPVPCGPFLIAMGGADGAVHVPHDRLETFAVVEPVDPLAVQVGQRGPVLRCGPTPDLTPHRIEGQLVSVVDLLVASKTPADRLPEQPAAPMDRVLAPPVVAHHQETAIRTDLRAAEFQPHPAIEIDPVPRPEPAPSGWSMG